MSIQAMEWAYKQDVTPAARKFVLVTLANYADAYGVAAVTPSDLAGLTGQDERTVRRHLSALASEDRLLEINPTYREDGGRDANETRLLMRQRVRPASAAPTRPASPPPGQIAHPPLGNSRPDPLGKLPTHTSSSFKTTNNTAEVAEEPREEDAMSQQYQAAIRELREAGLLKLWQDWVRMNRMSLVTQERQIAKWAEWVRQGHSEALREHADYVMESGSYQHPHRGLESRMTAAVNGAAAQKKIRQDDADLRREGADEFPAGKKLRTRDGRVLTVEFVEYGLVNFEEPTAPPATLAQARLMEVAS